MASFRPETFTKIWDLGAKFAPCRTEETLGTAAKARKCRRFLKNAETYTRDQTGWLRTQSVTNRSHPLIPCYQGKEQGISKNKAPAGILTTESTAPSVVCSKIPYSREQGIFVGRTGNLHARTGNLTREESGKSNLEKTEDFEKMAGRVQAQPH
jgi:hypothetical protein